MQSKSKILQALLVIAVLAIYSSTYVIREGHYGVLLTWGKITTIHTEPGFHLKFPWPISSIQSFDGRVHMLDSQEEQVLTKDQNTLIIKSHIGWKIIKPEIFWQSIQNKQTMETHLLDLLRNCQNELFGSTSFSNIFKKDSKENMHLRSLENTIVQRLNNESQRQYGIEITFAGFDKLRFPDSVMEKVYEKMKSDREQISETLKAEAESESKLIRSKAKAQYEQKLAEAEGKVKSIIGKAEAESIEAYKVFAKDPDFALRLKKIESLNSLLKDRSTVILDPSIAPLDILNQKSYSTK